MIDEPSDEIRERWLRLVRSSAGGTEHTVSADIIADVLRRLAEPQRHYHTATHVMWVMRHVDALVAVSEDDVADPDTIVAAALFHDVIYDPTSATNEAESATLAASQMSRLGWAAERCGEMAVLIEATAGHEATTAAAAVLLDADLAVLGGAPDDYTEYVRNVRAEYSSVPDEAWRLGRSTVLRGFLDRPTIFATPTMVAQREAQARHNLASELASLHRNETR